MKNILSPDTLNTGTPGIIYDAEPHIHHISTPEQMVSQLDILYKSGYSGSIIIEENALPKSAQAYRELIIHMIAWQESMGHPFTFYMHADGALAELPELPELHKLMDECEMEFITAHA